MSIGITFILPVVAVTLLALLTLDLVNAQNMSASENNMTIGTNMTNATISGNVTDSEDQEVEQESQEQEDNEDNEKEGDD